MPSNFWVFQYREIYGKKEHCILMTYHTLAVDSAREDVPDLRRDILCVAQQCFGNLSYVIRQRLHAGLTAAPATREDAEEMFWTALRLERVESTFPLVQDSHLQ